MLFVLQSYYEYTGDERVLELMTRYFRWELTVPDERFPAAVLAAAAGRRQPGQRLLALQPHGRGVAARAGRQDPPQHGPLEHGGGQLAQREHRPGLPQPGRPTTCSRRTRSTSRPPSATTATVMELYGQVPGGMFGGDENCRPGYDGPRQAIETCGMVEMMLSRRDAARRSPATRIWADRCEEVAFNSFPAAMTADLKALRYLTAPNMVLSRPAATSRRASRTAGPMLLFDPHQHRCCQHNIGHGWPYYAEHLWMATPGNGLAAVLYAPCQVTAKVGDGTEVTIAEATRLPVRRDDRADASSTPKPVALSALPARARLVRRAPQVSVNGKPLPSRDASRASVPVASSGPGPTATRVRAARCR